jgi:hypothetical protein
MMTETAIFGEAHRLIANGSIVSISYGKSTPGAHGWKKYFCTLRRPSAQGSIHAHADTIGEAVSEAIRKLQFAPTNPNTIEAPEPMIEVPGLPVIETRALPSVPALPEV